MKVSSYIKQAIAIIKGDGAAEIAAKNERKATTAIKGAIGGLESERVDAEGRLDDAKEAYALAVHPADVISNRESYLNGISRAKENLDEAKQAITDIDESITSWTNLLKAESAQVDADTTA